jgi:hypothetical protein
MVYENFHDLSPFDHHDVDASMTANQVISVGSWGLPIRFNTEAASARRAFTDD